ncbi:hypothetical protein K505DRAFT_258984 [Melanomma pulvis-pyrius CBS 109.77]|uniref:NACHT domain-containing protein n=1 Tax=Melanomma pulvis-pyrius CBS 109.77 TaxID=1314802 RepID=A0A6A6WSD6_9PLEO|nr:hypothetical protein K505DRAFT_258984 [Melanomma pulvis-pyrius CBS 109.77]
MANIRTSLPFPTRPWETAKNKFLENLSPEEIQQFQNATLENFFYDASSAQKKHARGSRVWELQEKLASLAEGIDDYGKALDVYSNAYGLILCPIWGSVRVVLNIALEAGKFQEKIVDMFARIGDALPRFRIYQSLFRKHERLLRALSAAYLDILKFCIMAKDFFLLPMSIICMAIWKPFQKQFNDYIVAFRTHQKMVEKEAGLAHLIESARSREIELANRALQERNEKIHRRHRIFSALPSIGYQTKHDIICSHRHPGTNTWLQTHYNFVGWLSSQSSDCLSCFGIPGSGKSVLSASTIDYLIELSQPSSVVCYYYCDYADPLSLDASRLIATIIKQVLVHLPLDHFNDAFDCPFETDRPTPSHSKCQEFLLRLFENFTEVFIVLDGIDELAQYSQSIVLNMVNDLLHSSRTRVKVFVTSRCEECLIRESLESYRVIDLGTDHLQADVELFVTRKLESTILSQRLDFSDSLLKREIIQALVNGANGM